MQLKKVINTDLRVNGITIPENSIIIYSEALEGLDEYLFDTDADSPSFIYDYNYDYTENNNQSSEELTKNDIASQPQKNKRK